MTLKFSKLLQFHFFFWDQQAPVEISERIQDSAIDKEAHEMEEQLESQGNASR